ncbi:Gfo/Idh/MocA family oxidoreductase [Oceanirhabdus seepicola]|uniref:Gfo/Idh/MocA family oxidoreductase n=1 Tax=Oceanirhabdus seepicola TaxID=2828781 RepID=A0A9J6NXZ9_9CLOT|nr:Gfo/Idh/MocA family oxidoreductase [Oceanirhabdus seepicola]MCM1989139.1 Gfo/Idh/MocA family oxidoreductase [Oceanirhabdus seepicola]
MNKLKVGIIGFGMSGRVFHAPLLESMKEYEINKIYTKNPEAIKLAEKEYPNARVVQDKNEIIKDEEIELVILAVPNKVHFILAKDAMENGKHVVIEKPFVVNSEEGGRLIEISHREKRILSVYHNRRYDSDFRTIKKVIEKGMVGEVVEYEAYYNRFRNFLKGNWREEQEEGSGILFDLGSHLIDQALTLFGYPEKVFGDIRTQRKCAKTTDYFQVTLYYGENLNNLKVTLKAGMLVRESTPRYFLTGENGNFVKYGLDVQENDLKNGRKLEGNMEWGKEPKDIWGILNSEVNGMSFRGKIESEVGDYRDYYRNIHNAIVLEEKLEVTAEQALDVIKIIELAELSSREGRIINT